MFRTLAAMISVACLILLVPDFRNSATQMSASSSHWTALSNAAPLDDKPFSFSSLSPQDNSHLKNLLAEIRTLPSEYFVFPLADHVYEPFLYDLALPKLLVNPGVKPPAATPTVFGIGPHLEKSWPETSHPFWERWLRMLGSLVCWIGATALFRGLSLPLRVLTGLLVTGWGMCLLSLLTGASYSTLYSFWIPVSALGAAVLVFKDLRWPKNYGWVLLCLCIPWLWSPFFLQPLMSPDARTMWFYRYKFAFFYGFNPELILKYMSEGAQRDYPWFLAGPLGIASWHDSHSFAGWHENAVYGSLAWVLFAIIALWWRALKPLNIVLRVVVVLATFGAFSGYASNGYMDVFWISLFALFLFGGSTFTKAERWVFLATAASFKNEAVASLAVFCLVLAATKRIRDIPLWLSACTAPVAQKILLSFWGIKDQYKLAQRICELPLYDAVKRFESANRFLLKRVFLEKPQYLVPLIILLAIGASHGKLKRSLKLIGLTYLFALPMIFIYTYTPHDQEWQLITSGFRVFMLFPLYAALSSNTLISFSDRPTPTTLFK